jgi:hypothetical protein
MDNAPCFGISIEYTWESSTAKQLDRHMERRRRSAGRIRTRSFRFHDAPPGSKGVNPEPSDASSSPWDLHFTTLPGVAEMLIGAAIFA